MLAVEDVLRDYFTGKLAVSIHLYKLGRMDVDSYELQLLEFKQTVIETMLKVIPLQYVQVLQMHFKNRMTWQEVVRITHIDERTCIRWRDDFRKLVGGNLWRIS